MKQRYSYTREIILNTIKISISHPNANSIFNEVAKTIPHISMNTIYRNLGQLVENKIINEIDLGGKAHYCGNLNPHIHFHCLSCNMLSDGKINYDEFLKCFNSGDFEPSDYYVEIKGVCKSCNQKQKIKAMENQVIKRIRIPER